MKTSTIFASLALAALNVAAVPNRRAVDDATVLNFALTLEHLENEFYRGALEKFDEAAFAKAGLPSFARGRFAQVAAHEKAHVDFLSAALGDKAVKPCTYKFPYTDPASFAALSQVLEGVGVSAYAGAAQFITNKDYLTAAAVVLSTEARHASWVAAAVNKVAGWSGALDTPLEPNSVYTLAASFITSCPSTNAPLPFKAYPALTFALSKASPSFAGSKKILPGSTVKVTYDAASASGTQYVAFFTGLAPVFVEIKGGEIVIPKDVRGTLYGVVTKSATSAKDADIVAGVAVVDIETNSKGDVIA